MIFALLVAASVAAASPGHTIHVAPATATFVSAADGSTKHPFTTLHDARDAAREYLASAPLAADLAVSLAAGSYELPSSLEFTELDAGGRDGRRVVWSGPSDGEARILGGTRVADWERAWGEVYRTRLGRRVYGLSENGKQANPARHPNTNPGEGSGWFNGAVNNGGFNWPVGSLPPNVSHFGIGNVSMRMTAGHNYYWSENWPVSSFNLTSRSGTFRQDAAKLASKMNAGPHVRRATAARAARPAARADLSSLSATSTAAPASSTSRGSSPSTPLASGSTTGRGRDFRLRASRSSRRRRSGQSPWLAGATPRARSRPG